MIKKISWNSFLLIGMIFAIMMAARDEYRDGAYQLIIVGIFSLFGDINFFFTKLIDFIKNFSLFAIVTIIWTVYFGVFNRTGLVSYRYVITAFGIIFAGYHVASAGRDELQKTLEKLWVLIFAILLLAIVNRFLIPDFTGDFRLFYLNSIAEGDAAIVLALISLFYLNDKWRKHTGVIIAFAIEIIGARRLDTVLLVAIMLIYLLMRRKQISEEIVGGLLKNKKNKFIVVGIVMLVALMMVFISKDTDPTFIEKLNERYLSAFSSLSKDVYLNYLGDISLRIRISAINQVLNIFREGTVLDVILGGGLLRGYYSIKPSMTMLSMAAGIAAGPIENAFFALLADYGAVAFVLFAGTYITSFYTAFFSKSAAVRTWSLFVIAIMTLSAFIDMEYWINIVFFLWVIIGMYLWELANAKEVKAYIPSLVFSIFAVTILYYLPCAYSWIRTARNAYSAHIGGVFTFVIGFISIIAIAMIAWNVSRFLSDLFIIHKVKGRSVVFTMTSTTVLIAIIVVGNYCINDMRGVLMERIDGEKEIITEIKKSARGEVYNDTYPVIYNEIFGEIQGTLFSGASLANHNNTTVIMSIEDEAQVLTNAGFLYLPISQWDEVYTNDEGVIARLKEMGYNPRGFNDRVYEVDLDNLAKANGLTLSENNTIILGGTADGLVNGTDIDVYPGKYTATYTFKLLNMSTSENDSICTLEINSENLKVPAAIHTISRSDFDDEGNFISDIIFTGGIKECDFTLLMENEDELELCSISYTRTPDYDTHVKYDDNANKIWEGYYTLEGEPFVQPTGQASVEYEYDDAGNNTVVRYYDAEGEPVLYNNQYWCMERAFNGNKQVTKEIYYGVDGDPAILSDGASGYKREYDEKGRLVKLTYQGPDGDPINNTLGYAVLERKYNDKGQLARDDYYDTDNNPVELAGGQGAVEYEYDKDSNNTIIRYYDKNGEPVLYYEQYWYVNRTFNDKKQVIKEEYYDTSSAPAILNEGVVGYEREYDERGRQIKITNLGADGNSIINKSGYAVLIREYNDHNQIVREKYLDENNNPVELEGGQASVTYEYDEEGNNTVIRYFDVEGKPVLYNDEYWYVDRIFNENKQVIREDYYDKNDEPVSISKGYACIKYVYNHEGVAIKKVYYDLDGTLVGME
ncbi:RHS repeat protein [Butyrivibrio sp. FC2001]|uniref:RHS repeat protein n=1 Tax=Butyrivibrio sp. FC2001 TaxID=1280671 RepID=UPI0003F6C194|nr:RHS repeat protein [Butyrivibrio sp. FC2001]